MVKKKACVFISGQGSNLKFLIKNSRDQNFPINISLVISDNLNAKGILHAKKNSIPVLIINTKKRNFENIILKNIKKHKVSLICLAGYMKIISKKFISNYGKKIVNIHPSLLPKFPGLNSHRKAIDAKEKYHGATVHFATEELDGGPIISQEIVEIDPIDTEYSLAQKVLEKEHILYPRVIHWYTQNRLKLINNDRVELDGKTL